MNLMDPHWGEGGGRRRHTNSYICNLRLLQIKVEFFSLRYSFSICSVVRHKFCNSFAAGCFIFFQSNAIVGVCMRRLSASVYVDW